MSATRRLAEILSTRVTVIRRVLPIAAWMTVLGRSRTLAWRGPADLSTPYAAIGSIRLGSLFLMFPTRALTGQQIISSAG